MRSSFSLLKAAFLGMIASLGCGLGTSVSINNGEIMVKIGNTPVVDGSGKIASENRDAQNFHRIEASHSIEVVVDNGDADTVTVEADDNLLPLIRTAVSSGTLKVECSGSLKTRNPIRVLVTAKKIDGLTAQSSARIKAKSVQGDKIEVAASSSATVAANEAQGDHLSLSGTSSGSVSVNKVQGKKLDVDANSSGSVTADGQVDRLKVDASSSGSFHGKNLVCKTAKVDCSSSGSASVHATDEITGSASSAGSVSYAGSPGKVDVSTSSAGSVHKSK